MEWKHSRGGTNQRVHNRRQATWGGQRTLPYLSINLPHSSALRGTYTFIWKLWSRKSPVFQWSTRAYMQTWRLALGSDWTACQVSARRLHSAQKAHAEKGNRKESGKTPACNMAKNGQNHNWKPTKNALKKKLKSWWEWVFKHREICFILWTFHFLADYYKIKIF